MADPGGTSKTSTTPPQGAYPGGSKISLTDLNTGGDCGDTCSISTTGVYGASAGTYPDTCSVGAVGGERYGTDGTTSDGSAT